MEGFSVQKIGVFRQSEGGARIVLEEKYRPALAGLEGFGHLQVLWWFSHSDTPETRATLQEQSPYKHGPRLLGVFATRSPQRPNPIALSCVQVTGLDAGAGVIELAYADADDGTPVLDIKPYTPSLDRVEAPRTPDWCAHWPQNLEDSGRFNWEAEFNF